MIEEFIEKLIELKKKYNITDNLNIIFDIDDNLLTEMNENNIYCDLDDSLFYYDGDNIRWKLDLTSSYIDKYREFVIMAQLYLPK